MLNLEIKRAFRKKSFFIAMLIGILITILKILDAKYYGITLEYYLKNPIAAYNTWILLDEDKYSEILILILPVIATIPFGDSYYEDNANGFCNYIFTRIDKKKYIVSKYLANFIVAGLTITIPLIINLLISYSILPNIEMNNLMSNKAINDKDLLFDLYLSSPILYILFRSLMCFLFAGAFSSIALGISCFIRNRFISLLTPFIVYMGMKFIAEILNKMRYSPDYFLISPRSGTLYIALIELGVIISTTFIMFFYRGTRHECR